MARIPSWLKNKKAARAKRAELSLTDTGPIPDFMRRTKAAKALGIALALSSSPIDYLNEKAVANKVGGGTPTPSLTYGAVAVTQGNTDWFPANASTTAVYITDSLGPQLHGAPILKIAQWLATYRPNHTINYYEWSDDKFTGTNSYPGTPAYTRSGTNGLTINIYLAGVGTTTLYYLLGAKFPAAIAAPNPDWIGVLHGKNMTGSTMPGADLLAGMETIRTYLPGKPIHMILEPPNQTNNNMALVNEGTFQGYNNFYGDVQYITKWYSDVKAYKDGGGDMAVYVDDELHPNALSVDTFFVPAATTFYTTTKRPATVAPALLSTTNATKSYAGNGNFAAYPTEGAAQYPTGYTSPVNNATASKDTANKMAGNTYSVKLIGTAAASQLRYTLSAPQMSALSADGLAAGAGSLAAPRKVIVLAWVYFPPTPTVTNDSAGYIALVMNDGGGVNTGTARNKSSTAIGPKGGWAVFATESAGPVAGTITSCNVQLGVDTVTNTNSFANYQNWGLFLEPNIAGVGTN